MRLVERHFESLIAAGVGDIVGALAFRAAERPAAPACLLLDRGERETAPVSYSALWTMARRIAAGLTVHAAPGGRVLLAFPAGADFVAALFGCFIAGRIAVPAPPARNARGAARLEAIARDCRAALLLTTAAICDAVAGSALRTLTPEDLHDAGLHGVTECAPESIALLQYTSGSTGAPKGAVIPHRAIWHNQSVIRTCFDHAEGVTLVGWLPNFHDMGLIGNLLQPIYAGGLTVTMEPSAFVQKPLRWLRAISHYGAHTSGAPNFAYDLCVRAAEDADLSDLDLSRWRVAFNGAEPVRASTIEAFAGTFAQCGFRREATMACYGLAESTLMVSGGPVDTAPKAMRASRAQLARGAVVAEDAGANLVSCGRPVVGADVRIVDPHTLAARAAGDIGEVLVRSDSLCAGYWGAAAAPFVAVSGASYLRTGDLGAFVDGELYVVGRVKDVLILNGRNVHPADIEAAVEGALAGQGVLRVAATGVAGALSEEVLLFLELTREALRRVDADALMAAVRRAAAEAAGAAPAGIALLKPGALLRTSSGKLRRAACRDRFLAGALAGAAHLDAGAARLMGAGALAGEPHSR